jgi:hypothetical protein
MWLIKLQTLLMLSFTFELLIEISSPISSAFVAAKLIQASPIVVRKAQPEWISFPVLHFNCLTPNIGLACNTLLGTNALAFFKCIYDKAKGAL